MIKMKRWSLYRPDGHYLGQYSAFAAETAFAEYLMLQGRTVSEREIEVRPAGDGMEIILFEGNEYLLVPTPKG